MSNGQSGNIIDALIAIFDMALSIAKNTKKLMSVLKKKRTKLRKQEIT